MEGTMAHLIVEQTFGVPLTDEEHGLLGQKLDKCLAMHGARWVRSYLATDRRRMVCEFEAADAEAVRTSYRSAGVRFDRVWTAELFATPGSAPSRSTTAS
jgi:hypothetical protein